MPSPDVLAGGHYARKQIFSRNRLVAWSHTRRFAVARQLVSPYAGRRLLDYGSGDGTFLAMVHDLFPSALGVDIEPAQVRECADRLSSLTGLTFATTDAIGQAHYSGEFQVVTCMKVLEHCPEEDVDWILEEMFSYATRFVYATIACYPAQKHLPNGENAHCTIQPVEWWEARFARQAAACPGVEWEAWLQKGSPLRGVPIEELRIASWAD